MAGPSRIRSWLEQLLHTHDTPHRTAGAYALGVFLAFSPMLGLHTVLGLALAFVFGLNRVAVVLGVYTNLPWLVPAYYTLATIAGAAVLGVDVQPQALEEAMRAVSTASWREFGGLARRLAPLMWAYTLGIDRRRHRARGGGLPRIARDDPRPPQAHVAQARRNRLIRGHFSPEHLSSIDAEPL